jgi:hypothetical protein
MAREATARLYDVDQPSVVFKRLTESGRYDTGEVKFRAKNGKLIDLDRLYESVWATRLSQGTRSGVVHLEVTAVGTVVIQGDSLFLRVEGYAEPPFVLMRDPEDKEKNVLAEVRAALENGKTSQEITGRVEGWTGRWPTVLSQDQPKPRRLIVTAFQTADE